MLIATVTKEKKKNIYIYIYIGMINERLFFFMTNIHQRKALNHQLA